MFGSLAAFVFGGATVRAGDAPAASSAGPRARRGASRPPRAAGFRARVRARAQRLRARARVSCGRRRRRSVCCEGAAAGEGRRADAAGGGATVRASAHARAGEGPSASTARAQPRPPRCARAPSGHQCVASCVSALAVAPLAVVVRAMQTWQPAFPC